MYEYVNFFFKFFPNCTFNFSGFYFKSDQMRLVLTQYWTYLLKLLANHVLIPFVLKNNLDILFGKISTLFLQFFRENNPSLIFEFQFIGVAQEKVAQIAATSF